MLTFLTTTVSFVYFYTFKLMVVDFSIETVSLWVYNENLINFFFCVWEVNKNKFSESHYQILFVTILKSLATLKIKLFKIL